LLIRKKSVRSGYNRIDRGYIAMTDRPLASVLIPVYNQEAYVAEAVRSVLEQSYSSLELLLLDDASTDRTAEIFSKFETEPRVRLYRNEKNLGFPRTCNLGYSLARGEFLAIIAGDDTYAPDFLEKCIGALLAYPAAGFVYTRISLMDQSGKKRPRKRDRICHQGDFYGREFDNIVRWLNPIPHGATVVRKRCVEELGAYDPELTAGHDWEFWLRLSKRYPSVFINEHLMNYRVHSENITNKRARMGEREKHLIAILDRVFAMEGISEELRRDKNEIYARAYLDVAEGYRKAGEPAKMRHFLFQALSLCKKPPLYLPYRRLLASSILPRL